MSGTEGWISLIQSLSVSAEPHSFPKAPLCHELSLNATPLSIDLLAMHFLSCFDVIVVSVYGRSQIKLWRVLAFKLVISGDYSAAVELTFFIHFFFWPQTGLFDSFLQRRYRMPITDTLLPWTPSTAEETSADWVWGERCVEDFSSLAYKLCSTVQRETGPWSQGSERNKTHSPNLAQRDHYVLQWNHSLLPRLCCYIIIISKLWHYYFLLTERTQSLPLFWFNVSEIEKK